MASKWTWSEDDDPPKPRPKKKLAAMFDESTVKYVLVEIVNFHVITHKV